MITIYQKIDNGDGSFSIKKLVDNVAGSMDIKDGVWNTYVEGILPSEGPLIEELLSKVANGGLIIDDADGITNDTAAQLNKEWITYIPGILSLEGDNIEYLTRFVPEGGLVLDDD